MTGIELPGEQAALKAKASAAGLTLEAWLQKLAAEQQRPRGASARAVAKKVRYSANTSSVVTIGVFSARL
jgi:hypothetical protein